MSQSSIPRGTARAIRRGNNAPSIGFIRFEDLEIGMTDWNDLAWERKCRQEYRDLREEGYSYTQAMLMSGLGDPDSLGCT